MTLTKKQAISEHRKMWNWISDEIEKLKEVTDIGYLKINYLTGVRKIEFGIANHCFCCEYDIQKNNSGFRCVKCPIEWVSESKGYMCQDRETEEDNMGLYLRCIDAETWQEQAALARQIANLPERKDE